MTQNPDEEKKYIVFENQLLELFAFCPFCAADTQGEIQEVVGNLVKVKQSCASCGHNRTWSSQTFIRNMPAGNLLMSAAVVISGSLVAKVLQLFTLMNIACISRSTFFRHQSQYVHPIVVGFWKEHQRQLFDVLRLEEGGLILAGDCRSDSPGHCAKFGTYSVIEQRLNQVIDIHTVQSNEVPSSSWCEIEGLKRIMQHLGERDLRVSTLITDRHRQIAKWMRTERAEIDHLYDVWHVCKSIRKKLDAAAKQKDCEEIGYWWQSITNHLYWSAASSPPGNGELIVAKWQSILHHIHNEHVNLPNPLYPACSHEPLAGDARDKDWFQPNTKASVKLEAVVQDKMLLKDIAKLSTEHQTSSLEAFHSLVQMFAPKNTGFS